MKWLKRCSSKEPFWDTMAGLRKLRQIPNIPTWFCPLHEVSFEVKLAPIWCFLRHLSLLETVIGAFYQLFRDLYGAKCVNQYIFSPDKTLIVWKLTRDETQYGVPEKRLYGHSHFISDVVLSSDGNYALSGSWDKTLRLWDLAAGKTTRRFEDHTKVW